MYDPLTEQCMPEGAPVHNDVIMNLGVWETPKSKNAITEPK